MLRDELIEQCFDLVVDRAALATRELTACAALTNRAYHRSGWTSE